MCWAPRPPSSSLAACQALGHRGAGGPEFFQGGRGPWWTWGARPPGSGGPPKALQAQGGPGACPSRAGLVLKCLATSCGEWGASASFNSSTPSLALLLHVPSKSSCPATLISPSHLLTSSFCLSKDKDKVGKRAMEPRDWVVFAGMANSRQIKVIQSTSHPIETSLLFKSTGISEQFFVVAIFLSKYFFFFL